MRKGVSTSLSPFSSALRRHPALDSIQPSPVLTSNPAAGGLRKVRRDRWCCEDQDVLLLGYSLHFLRLWPGFQFTELLPFKPSLIKEVGEGEENQTIPMYHKDAGSGRSGRGCVQNRLQVCCEEGGFSFFPPRIFGGGYMEEMNT